MNSEETNNKTKLPDLPELAEQLGVSAATLESVLRLFYDEYHALPEICTQLIKQHDWLALQAVVHKMKGSCGSLQMHALRSELVTVERCLKRGETLDVEALQPLFNALQHVIDVYQLNSK